MKIIFNNILNTNNVQRRKVQPRIPFLGVSDYGRLEKDTFSKSKYIDIEAFNNFFPHSNRNQEEAEDIIRANLAAYSFITMGERQIKTNSLNCPANYEFFQEIAQKQYSPKSRDMLFRTLSSSKVNSVRDLAIIIDLNNKLESKKIEMPCRALQLIDLYGKIENKDDINNFFLLLYGLNIAYYNSEEKCDYQGYINFIKELGFENETQFYKAFKHVETEDRSKAVFVDKIKTDYPYKRKSMGLAVLCSKKLTDKQKSEVNIGELYGKNAKVIDYIFEKNTENLIMELTSAIEKILTEEELTPIARQVIKTITDLSTGESIVAYYDFLEEEKIDTATINKLATTQYIEDSDVLDLISNRQFMLENLSLAGFEENEAKEFYLKFAQSLNAVCEYEGAQYYTNGLNGLLNIIRTFNIENDKELVAFYKNFENNQTNKSKNKKSNSAPQVKKEKIRDFVELMGFIDENMIEKFNKDKHYPLKSELIKKRERFKKIETAINKAINEKNANYLCHNAFYIFTNFYKEYEKNPNIQTFVETSIKKLLEKTEQDASSKLTREHLLGSFENPTMLDDFLEKNNIRLDDPTHNHSIRCIRVITALYKNKTLDEIHKLSGRFVKSDILRAPQTQLAKFINSKDDEELSLFFEIILDNKISKDDIEELNRISKKYVGKKSKKLANFLKYYQKTGLGFKEFIEKIESLQNELNNISSSILINDDTISNIDIELIKKAKINSSDVSAIAKQILNPEDDFNFIGGLKLALNADIQKHTAEEVLKELKSAQYGKYHEGYANIIETFNLENLIRNNNESQKANELLDSSFSKLISRELMEFINSPEWQTLEENKCINISLHAKMRLLERFILANGEEFNIDEAISKAKEVLNIVYKETPTKIKKSSNRQKAFSVIFDGKDAPIKAVFNDTGELFTIIVMH